MFLRERRLLCGMKVVLGRRSIREDSYPMGRPKEKKVLQGKDGLGENMGFKEQMGLWIRCVPKDA